MVSVAFFSLLLSSPPSLSLLPALPADVHVLRASTLRGSPQKEVHTLHLRVRGGDSLHFFHFVFHELLPLCGVVAETLASSPSSSSKVHVILLDRHLRDSSSPPRNPWRSLFYPLFPQTLKVSVVGAPPPGLSTSSFRTLPSFDRPLRWSPLLSTGAQYLRCNVCGFCREGESDVVSGGSPPGLVVQLRVPPSPTMQSFFAEYRDRVGRGAGGPRFFLYGSERRSVSNLLQVARALNASTDVPESHPSLCSQIEAYVNRSALVFGHGMLLACVGRQKMQRLRKHDTHSVTRCRPDPPFVAAARLVSGRSCGPYKVTVRRHIRNSSWPRSFA